MCWELLLHAGELEGVLEGLLHAGELLLLLLLLLTPIIVAAKSLGGGESKHRWQVLGEGHAGKLHARQLGELGGILEGLLHAWELLLLLLLLLTPIILVHVCTRRGTAWRRLASAR